MVVKKNSVVSIEYTLKNESGEVLDSSDGKDPLVYLHGVGQLLPKLEAELEGRPDGDELHVDIDAADGYGIRDESMVKTVPKKQFEDAEEMQVGDRFRADGPQGPVIFTVVSVDGENVVIDGNHPLAGVSLSFDVKVVGVREASPEELEHGHAHGPGGHSH